MSYFVKSVRYRQSGFTLIELMVVIAILGVLLALVAPNIIGRPDQARILRAQSDVGQIQTAMDLYRLDNGFYPSQQQGIESLVTRPTSPPEPRAWTAGGYLRSMPVDPWGNEYVYRNPGQHVDIDIFSYGANGIEGGEGDDAEIGNWPS